MNASGKSVQLEGGLKHTATWVKITDTGDLMIDFYDYSDEANDFFGNDVAYLLTIQATEKPRILRLLAGDDANVPGLNDAILQRMQAKFDSYFKIEQWLKENDVPFEKTFDSWA